MPAATEELTATPTGVAAEPQRLDIQALRALAVALVVVFHFWPGSLSGGYVGVDVFFVISGFLITSHLLRRPPTTVRDLAEFWGRRIRRLLPAAFTVLLATLAATWWLAPSLVWAATAKQAVASALYVQNWVLARDSVDYLAADNLPTTVQHYWSLSIEEQFYLGWPLLLLAVALVSRRTGLSLRRCAAVGVLVVLGASLAWSVLSGGDSAAYFVTWTRIWELAAGGLVAVALPSLPRLGPGVSTVLAWLGLALVVVAAVRYDGGTAFPGWAALVPVVGAALVILAAVRGGVLSPLPVMALRPVQWLGDVSYSVYLWHWPVVVLLPYALDREPGTAQKLLALAGVLGLSHLTKRFVEDPLRGRRPLGVPLRRSFVFALAGALVVAAGALALRHEGQQAEAAPSISALRDVCLGARAVDRPGCDLYGDGLVTSPAFAAADNAPAKDPSCVSSTSAPLREPSCHYGSRKPDAFQVAMIGNSHAAQWLPVFRAIAKARGWSLTTYFVFECHTSDRPVAFEDQTRIDGCETFNDRALAEVAEQDFDLVVLSNRTRVPLVGFEDDEEGNERAVTASFRRILDDWLEAGREVLVLRDNPRRDTEETGPACVEAHRDDLPACDLALSVADVWDPAADLVEGMPPTEGLATFDVRPWLCPDDVCRGVVGGVITLWDTNHLTSTFVRTLRPQIERALDEVRG